MHINSKITIPKTINKQRKERNMYKYGVDMGCVGGRVCGRVSEWSNIFKRFSSISQKNERDY